METYLDGLKYLVRRKVSPGSFNSQEWAAVAPAIRQRSFFSATINSARVLHRMRSMLLDWQSGATESILTPSGGNEIVFKESGLAKFREKAAALLISEGLASPEDFKNESIQNVISASRLKLIFNTNTAQAQDFAIYQSRVSDPARIDRFPAAEFVRTPGAKVPRTLHVANEGAVRRFDDIQFWLEQNSPDIGGFGVPWGPWGFNSFMTTFPVSRKRAEALGLVKPGEKVMPPDLTQFGATLPTRFNKGVNADISDITPDIRQQAINAITSRLGPQALTADGKLTLEGLKALRSGQIPAPAPVPVPIPAPATAPAPVAAPKPGETEPEGTKISSKLFRSASETRLEKILSDEVVQTIDSIHGDGPLPAAYLNFKKSTGTANGQYSLTDGNIDIFKVGKTPMTLTHEMGHWMDHKGFKGLIPNTGSKGIQSMASYSDLFSDFRKAAFQSRKIKEIFSSTGITQRSIDYFTSNHEMFARAYAQYIATKSGNPKMLEQLKERQGVPTNGARYPDQWDDDDFVPIAQEIEKIFIKVGWIKTK
jgi:hypothetical protein